MYRHCPSCTRDLGRNEALEHFPVGRRLAFDGKRGRLWVLCARCRAWNLAPIEERWEAVEEAERCFEGAAQGLTTEHIALGRLADGTELVRIGQAEGLELAGWRYANRIKARWKRAQWTGAAVTAGYIVVGPSGLASALFPFVLVGAAGVAGWQYLKKRDRRLEFEEDGDRGGPSSRVTLSSGRLRRLHLVASPGGVEGLAGSGGSPSEPDGASWSLHVREFGGRRIVIPSELRNRALRLSLLELNQQIGKPAHVQKALDQVVDAGDAERVTALAAQKLADATDWDRLTGIVRDRSALSKANPVLRLALEIAANEEAERVALEGELYRLELEWRDAEELAAISDGLLVPGWINRRVAAWRRGEEEDEPSKRRSATS